VIERYAPIANGDDFSSFHAGQEFCGFAKLAIGGPKWNVWFQSNAKTAWKTAMGAQTRRKKPIQTELN
jgi:hypothetical protein